MGDKKRAGESPVETSEHKKAVVSRMSRLIGHAQANKKMIEDDRYCIDVIRQNLAVAEALHKANEVILKQHLNTCVLTAMRGTNKARREEAIAEILEIYKASKK